jgi:hypothetical protein
MISCPLDGDILAQDLIELIEYMHTNNVHLIFRKYIWKEPPN